MEKLPPFTIFLFIHLSSLILPSSPYTPPVQYFINCGSDSTSTLEPGRSFVGDSPLLVVSGKPVKGNTSSSANTTLYQTARVFHKEKKSWYQFEINRQGTYIIRLHFFPFSSLDADLSIAIFHVKASGFTLLSDFTTPKNTSPVIEEFLLSINLGKFFIFFLPSNESSIAYVNAIELFLTPEGFVPNSTVKITPAGSKGNQSGVLFQALHKIHRINVGGSIWTGSNSDTLWRKWIKDDDFLSYPETAKDLTPFEGSLLSSQRVTEEIAPDFVYKTAKELKNQNVSNITWGFNVAKNSLHLVRVHFCDITGEALGNIVFNLHIYSRFSKKISPYDETNKNASPFYFDFVVESDSSGFMNISVSKRNDSDVENAFLNGLEIMEIIGKSDPDEQHKKKKNHQALFIIVSAIFLLVIIVALLVFFKTSKSKPYRKAGRPFSMPLFGGSSHSSGKLILPPELNLELKIPYSEIQQATKNFNSKLLIGEGGFGKVYKGILRQGVKVAVKRSEPGHGQGIAEFQTEIIILSQIHHRNLVSLIGYCDEKSEMILVYEFMEKGTLREHLYTSDSENNSTSRSELSWEERLKICIDSAKGIHYLHTGLPNRIIHRDLKSTNILLSEDYTAKVADFGLSKSGPVDPYEHTGSLKGSFGYLDPEYFMTSQLTEKSDVYSFGVVLLEVVCARPVIINSSRTEEMNLAEWGMNWHKKGQLETIIDPGLVGSINPSSLRKFGETAEKCLRGSSVERPVMQDVIWDLEFSLGLQKNSMSTQQDDISMTSNSLDPLALQIVERLPSQKGAVGEDDSFAGSGNTSTYTMASGIFSEIGIDAGR
ncbi:probable receptor-like protein kinase At5g24010 [Euphorbia lathyris]|uniref:probable receptor-like protein kinase At5g24010 n=1 Tax=Euphorbia lathyris TaxID=212925 RepID=UPI003313B5C6